MKKTIFEHLDDKKPSRLEVRKLINPKRTPWANASLARYFHNASNGGKESHFSVPVGEDHITSFEGIARIELVYWWKHLLHVVAEVLLWIFALTSGIYIFWKSSVAHSLPLFIIGALTLSAPIYIWQKYLVKAREKCAEVKNRAINLLREACYQLVLLHHHTSFDEPKTWEKFGIFEKVSIINDWSVIWQNVRPRLIQLTVAIYALEKMAGNRYGASQHYMLKGELVAMISRFFRQCDLITPSELEQIEAEAYVNMYDWARQNAIANKRANRILTERDLHLASIKAEK